MNFLLISLGEVIIPHLNLCNYRWETTPLDVSGHSEWFTVESSQTWETQSKHLVETIVNEVHSFIYVCHTSRISNHLFDRSSLLKNEADVEEISTEWQVSHIIFEYMKLMLGHRSSTEMFSCEIQRLLYLFIFSVWLGLISFVSKRVLNCILDSVVLYF